MNEPLPTPLSPSIPPSLPSEVDVAHFLDHGYVSIPFLSGEETLALHSTILDIVEHRTQHYPTYHPPYTLEYLHNLNCTISSKLSSTGGAGGVMDIHYDFALDKVRTDPRIFSIIKTLWGASYGSSAPGFELSPEVSSSFDFTRGIEVAPGYHKSFSSVSGWTSTRCGPASGPQPCFGPFTAVRNRSVTKDIRHVPVPAGSLFFWDEKIPHSTALAHLGGEGRVAVYLGFLPRGPCNDMYK
ncbi:hypothetical protein TrRE_jg7551, partial [Triparma retinervis]